MRKLVKFIITLAVLAILGYAASFFYRFRLSPGLSVAEGDLNIATLNVNAFRFCITRGSAASYISQICDENDVDIFCMQEFQLGEDLTQKVFDNLFKERFPYTVIDEDEAILSRYPILEHKQVNFENSDNSYSWNDIDVDGTTIRVFNVHLQTSGVNSVLSLYQHHGWDMTKIRALAEAMKGNDGVRWSQAVPIELEMRQSPYPVILAGDLNSHELSRIYRLFKKNRGDAYREKGDGPASTYRGLNGIVRTDYLFHDRAFTCTGYKRNTDEVSDHLMITASFSMPKN